MLKVLTPSMTLIVGFIPVILIFKNHDKEISLYESKKMLCYSVIKELGDFEPITFNEMKKNVRGIRLYKHYI